MDTVVPTLTEDVPILDAIGFLLQRKVTGAPVVNARNEVIGMLTEKDCLHLLSLGTEDADRPLGTVADFMTRNVTTIPPSMNIYFVAGMFMQTGVRRFPVVENGVLIGAITRFDILRAIRAGLVEG
jgi:CBS domain-containing protein